ncbi:Protein FAR1-RELATED SEQUENCE 5 [Zea mays]|uniref:Protein FAR1-RELATED SEQUENCE 5 n=1 Tax=Zea mays TaxID=4577 RepID=A0A1D6MZR2_MAIZE|nr:Protein FAR1-RELATED SEQUENCE 5 [Zea mays]ONM34082.1 Protein FAR1-RELATED SEQUENCE 5 [Zea mays]
MEGTTISIEIDGEAICLDSVGDNEQEAAENGEMHQTIYTDENGEQVAFDNQEQGREEDLAGNGEEDRDHNSIIPSREELTEELRNKVAYSEEEAYRLYCDYGHRMGFSVRKGKQYYFTGTKTIRTKDYYCSKEGLKDDEQLTEANFNKPETRTNCKAMVRFRVDSEGQWRVIQIIPEHNHELVRPEEIHLLRSVRTLSVPKSGVLNAMVNAEIQAMHDNLHINEDGTECHSQLSIRSYTLLEPKECEALEHPWLTDLYQQRHKWCSALHKDAFDGGIESMDRNESLNNVLSNIDDESASLSTFVLELDKLAGSWRKTESLEDIQCNQAAPECTVKHNRILQHAAEVYTHKVYKSIETDFLDGCSATSYQAAQCNETLHKFEFLLENSPNVSVVFLNTSTMELSCTCKKFETMRILCSHALNALVLKNVDRIPERYILNRWTKYARKGTYPFPVDEFAEQDRTEVAFVYRNRAMWFVYDLLTKSKSHHNTRKLILDALENGEKSLERNVKQAVLPQTADPVFVDPPNQDQYFAAEDIASNQSVGRPFFYQGYPMTVVSTSQIQGHTNMHSEPQCASQVLN